MMKTIKWLLLIVLIANTIYIYMLRESKQNQNQSSDDKKSEFQQPQKSQNQQPIQQIDKTNNTQQDNNDNHQNDVYGQKKQLVPIEQYLPKPTPGRTTVDIQDMTMQEIVDSRHPVLALQSGVFKLDPNFLPHISNQGEHLYLQLKEAIDTNKIERLKEIGIELTQYIHPNTWIVKINSNDQVTELKNLKFTHAIGKIDPRDKIEQDLLKFGVAQNHLYKDGRMSVLVRVRSPSVREEIFEQIKQMGGEVDNQDDIQYSSQQTLLVKLNSAALARIVQNEHVIWIQEKPQPIVPFVQQAAEFAYIQESKALFNLSGKGVNVGIWDGGTSEPHLDWGNKVKIMEIVRPDGKNYLSNNIKHAFHVTGITHFIAPNAPIKLFDFYGTKSRDLFSEIIHFVRKEKIQITNHSYDQELGCGSKDPIKTILDFGKYLDSARRMDETALTSNHLMINAVGNHRDQECVVNGKTIRDDTAHNGYMTVGMRAVAKNILTVGSVGHPLNENRGMGATTSPFSSWGPTKDGRIKPDVVAKGYQVRSTSIDAEYIYLSGTSMASPLVTGVAALGYERFIQQYRENPAPFLMKLFLIHTAEDWGQPGPDLQTGWGNVNALAMIDQIDKGQDYFGSTMFKQPSQKKVISFKVTDEDHIKLTATWPEPPKNAQALFDLVYDFNIKLISPSEDIYYPWVIDMNHFNKLAQAGVNHVDNVEQIMHYNPIPGEWRLVIDAPHNVLSKVKVFWISNIPKAKQEASAALIEDASLFVE